MHENPSNDEFLDRESDAICEGLRVAVDREVAILRREGLPIYVAENGRVVDLQERGRAAPPERERG